MNKVIRYGLWCFMLVLASCQDFLEPKSQSEYVPELVQSLQELLLGTVYMGPGDGALTSVLSFADDDVARRPDLTNFEAGSESTFEQVRLAFSWSDEMQLRLGNYNVYGTIYDKIVGCNAVLDYMDDVKGSKEDKDYVRAQALAMRAFYYYYLVNFYGKPYGADKDALGVPLKLTADLSTESIARSTVKRVYDQMVEDLSEAEKLFANVSRERQLQREGLVNLPMVDLLLSRIYLYMENWSEAMEYGEKVINDFGISLLDLNVGMPGGSKSRDYFVKENPEVIFLFGDAYGTYAFAASRVDIYDGKNYFMNSIAVASDSLIKQYDRTDLRLDNYLYWEFPMDGTPPVYRLPFGKVACSYGSNFPNQGGTAWGGALRVAEAYLNVAEAAAMLFKAQNDVTYLTKACNLMDRLRENRYRQGTYRTLDITAPDELIRFVRDERRRELCFEFHRWFDLRRYGMDEMKHLWYDNSGNPVEYKLENNDPGFTLLIPQEAFNLNHSLVQNEKRGK
ncbi:RagB/SusD family nutrient uptake outer membrane protein [Butyricimonas sp. Marseille-P3923]|uniref:RagB/SusD family nutrient uptake outer membrane protein n=1 Tax=Butyricimonas sp. Marseille-P3923 TaxID=1987504 RepID=UPI000C08CAE3|nr:RagB/SusD family nutrient uptake outer membrane protein [Butyricimonas sp. Marseille-P3923]